MSAARSWPRARLWSEMSEQVVDADVEGVCHLDQCPHGRIPGPAFQIGEITALHGDAVGQLFLRPSALFP